MLISVCKNAKAVKALPKAEVDTHFISVPDKMQ